MKTAQLAVVTTLLAITRAAPADPQKRASQAYAQTFSAPMCVSATGSGDASETYNLPLNTCVRPEHAFSSFRSGTSSKCSSGQLPAVISYSSTDCTGTGIETQSLPPDGTEGPCVTTIINPSKAALGSQSLKFVCQ